MPSINISNNLVVWGSAASEWASGAFDQHDGNALGFLPGSLIYAQQVNRAFRNATVMQWGIAQVLASKLSTVSAAVPLSFSIGFSDVQPTAQAMSSFANNLHSAFVRYMNAYATPSLATAAEMFNSPKTINIFGAVSGSAASTGAGGWGINVAFPSGIVTSAALATSAVTRSALSAGAVGSSALGASAVTSSAISAGAVTAAKLASSAVTSSKISQSAVTRDKIADGAVSNNKLANPGFTLSNGLTYLQKTVVLGLSYSIAGLLGASAGTQAGHFAYSPLMGVYVDPTVSGDQSLAVPNGYLSNTPCESAYFPKASIVGNDAFNGCSELSTASFPKARYIGNHAFYSCVSLTSLSSPEVASVGVSAFAGCLKLSVIEAPKLSIFTGDCFEGVGASSGGFILSIASVSSISGSLANLNTLKSFYGASLTNVASSFFRTCTSLQSVYLPNVLTVGEDAFSGCSSLPRAELLKCYSVGENAFSGCTSLSLVTLSTGFTEVPSYCFASTGLQSIPNQNSISRIEGSAFKGCASLGSINLPALSYVGNGAFSGCTSLSEASFGTSVTQLFGYTFAGCTSLMSLRFSYANGAVAVSTNTFVSSPVASGNAKLYVPTGARNYYLAATSTWASWYSGKENNIIGY